VITILKMYRDGATLGDLKLINIAVEEMRYSNLASSRLRS
jgi:hypothetical protein